MQASPKQLILKPQDLVLALKLAVNRENSYLLATLGSELQMVVSAVHASVVRCEQARLITRSNGVLRAYRPALTEFAIHGVRYVYPAVLGPLTRGVATISAGPSLKDSFDQTKAMPTVWPDPLGDTYGTSLAPLCQNVPQACRVDQRLYDVLTLIDAVRGGASRERELATTFIRERLT